MTGSSPKRRSLLAAGWLAAALTFAPEPAAAVTLTVAGVIVDGESQGRAGGAAVYLVRPQGGAPWAADTSSETGVYTLVARNLVGDAPVTFHVVYLGEGTQQVAKPIAITVHPDAGEVQVRKPGDLALWRVDRTAYQPQVAAERLEAIAETSELLRKVEGVEAAEIDSLERKARNVRQRTQAASPEEAGELDRLMGRVAVSSAFFDGASASELDRVLESGGLGGELDLQEPGLTREAAKLIADSAKVLAANPETELEVSILPGVNVEAVEAELVRRGIDPARLRAEVATEEAAPQVSIQVRSRERQQ